MNRNSVLRRVVPLCFLLPGLAGFTLTHSQSSQSFRLLGGNLAVTGGGAQSASYRLTESAGSPAASGTATSSSYILNGGMLLTALSNPETLPVSLGLLQNYPNPFNPATTIGYELPRRTGVRLTIANVLGATVRLLVEEEQEAGSYRVTWNGENDLGQPVASGVYYYQLATDGSPITRKMVLLR